MGGSHIFFGNCISYSAENVGIKDPENQLVPEVVKQMLQDLGCPGFLDCDRIVEIPI